MILACNKNQIYVMLLIKSKWKFLDAYCETDESHDFFGANDESWNAQVRGV